MNYLKRKYPRLKNQILYMTPGQIAHITIGTDKKVPLFKKSEYAELMCRIIENTSKEKHNPLYAYCVMPDHIHILAGAVEECSLIEFVKYVKGRFSTECRKQGWNTPLQRSFYDHILRKEENIEDVARYIIGNPIRAGISDQFGMYPYAGSLEFRL